jgi:hypothetical protein
MEEVRKVQLRLLPALQAAQMLDPFLCLVLHSMRDLIQLVHFFA